MSNWLTKFLKPSKANSQDVALVKDHPHAIEKTSLIDRALAKKILTSESVTVEEQTVFVNDASIGASGSKNGLQAGASLAGQKILIRKFTLVGNIYPINKPPRRSPPPKPGPK